MTISNEDELTSATKTRSITAQLVPTDLDVVFRVCRHVKAAVRIPGIPRRVPVDRKVLVHAWKRLWV
jgi:hypothetical protein